MIQASNTARHYRYVLHWTVRYGIDFGFCQISPQKSINTKQLTSIQFVTLTSGTKTKPRLGPSVMLWFLIVAFCEINHFVISFPDCKLLRYGSLLVATAFIDRNYWGNYYSWLSRHRPLVSVWIVTFCNAIIFKTWNYIDISDEVLRCINL